jgi:hypothetical protein
MKPELKNGKKKYIIKNYYALNIKIKLQNNEHFLYFNYFTISFHFISFIYKYI